MKEKAIQAQKSPFGLHEGEALLKLAALYPTLLEILLEEVQNSLDTNSSRIWVGVDFKARVITVEDNGEGVTQEKFEAALAEVCKTQKPTGKLGRFGVGLISPLGKAERFAFTSTPKSNPHDYREWNFVTEELRQQRKIEGIPFHPRADLWYGSYTGKGVTPVQWRSQMRIERFTKDRLISRITVDSLRDRTLEKYIHTMRRLNTVVSVRIKEADGKVQTLEFKAPEFEGTKLPEAEIHQAGRTNFKLYLAKKGPKGRGGKVLVGEYGNDFRLSFSTFLRSLPEECKISSDAVQALMSGIFEGDIVNNRIRLNPDRKSFELGDALVGFCEAINQWFEKEGINYFAEAQEERESERFQRLGLSSLRVIEGMMANEEHRQFLEDVFRHIQRGTIGKHHFPHPGKLSDLPSLSVEGYPTGDGGDYSGGVKDEPAKEKMGHHPLTVTGPKGKRRRIVRSSSLGLQLVHDSLETGHLWLFDPEIGALTFNTRHPLWVRCDEKGDKVLIRFQNFIILQALEVQRITDEGLREIARTAFEDVNPLYVFELLHGDALSGLIPQRPAKKASGKEARDKVASA